MRHIDLFVYMPHLCCVLDTVFQMVSVDWQSIVRAVNICFPLHSCWWNILDNLPAVSACACVRRHIDETVDPDIVMIARSQLQNLFLLSLSFSCLTVLSPSKSSYMFCFLIMLTSDCNSQIQYTNIHPRPALCRRGCWLKQFSNGEKQRWMVRLRIDL